ncbi:MAG: hypothetical protein ACRC5C_11600 [Bacilli bacterium]
MLTFEEKLAIITSFKELSRNDVSLGRVNFQYDESIYEKKNVVYHLHPNGNGFVFTGYIDTYDHNDKGYTNIRDYDAVQLRKIITDSITSLQELMVEELWVDDSGNELTLMSEMDLWNVYAGELLDGTFTTYGQAAAYLDEEGFRKKE